MRSRRQGHRSRTPRRTEPSRSIQDWQSQEYGRLASGYERDLSKLYRPGDRYMYSDFHRLPISAQISSAEDDMIVMNNTCFPMMGDTEGFNGERWWAFRGRGKGEWTHGRTGPYTHRSVETVDPGYYEMCHFANSRAVIEHLAVLLCRLVQKVCALRFTDPSQTRTSFHIFRGENSGALTAAPAFPVSPDTLISVTEIVFFAWGISLHFDPPVEGKSICTLRTVPLWEGMRVVGWAAPPMLRQAPSSFEDGLDYGLCFDMLHSAFERMRQKSLRGQYFHVLHKRKGLKPMTGSLRRWKLTFRGGEMGQIVRTIPKPPHPP